MQNEPLARIERLKGRQDMLIKEKGKLIGRIDENASLVDGDDAAMAILHELQAKYATSSVELYSELLTSMVRSVMPHYSQRIILKPGVYANKPALDIMAVNEAGEEESIDDQGGSISNLLAAGLRFIGLALSTNRRIAILDESDCWVESDLVPQFLTLIHDMCVKLGLQVVFVSHHHNALDEVGVAKVRLKSVDGATRVVGLEQATIETQALPSEEVHAQAMIGSGIRYIRLQNYMSHEDSLIPLQPGLTALVGENNIGKSVVTRAFSDIISNNRNPKRIRHEMSEATVELGLEGGYTLTWQLNSKRAGHCTGSYSLLDDSDQAVHVERNITALPTWFHDYMAMRDVNGLNLHIGHQKDPLFVLNPAISRHKRAELIHLGNEYEKINRMLKRHRANVADAKRQIKDLRSSTDSVSEDLSALAALGDLASAARPLQYGPQSSIKSLDMFLQLTDAGQSLEALQSIEGAMATDMVDYSDIDAINSFLKLQTVHSNAIGTLHDALSIGDALHIQALEDGLRSIKQFAAKRQQAFMHHNAMMIGRSLSVGSDYIATNDVERIRELIETQESATKLQADLDGARKQLTSIERQLIESGNVCPTCKQFTAGDTNAHSHH